MVHYVRYLRTPQVKDVSKKTIELSAVAVITTDLGDSFLAQDVTLVARVVDATKNEEILCTTDVQWKTGSRALKLAVTCSSKHLGRLVYLQLTTRNTISALSSINIPAVIDVYSSRFLLKPKAKPEEMLVERRIVLHGKSKARIWEETGDSIARHIWDASLGCVMQLNSCFSGKEKDQLPFLTQLLVADPAKRIRVLEVGAGCGIVGIALSQMRKAEVVLTDLEDAQDIMQTNTACAAPISGSSLSHQVLGWGTGLADLENSRFDLVLVSDCIYNPDSSVLLVQTLKELAAINASVLIFVAFKRRHDADEIFFEHMQQTDLSVIEQKTLQLPHVMTDFDAVEPEIEMFVYGRK